MLEDAVCDGARQAEAYRTLHKAPVAAASGSVYLSSSFLGHKCPICFSLSDMLEDAVCDGARQAEAYRTLHSTILVPDLLFEQI